MVIPNDIFFDSVKEELSQGNSVRIRVKGTSMNPTFKTDVDLVVLDVPKVPLRPRDIVLFNHKGRIKLHRIIKIVGNRLYIRGDGIYLAPFEECSMDDVIAVVTSGTMLGERIKFRSKSFGFRTYSLLYVASYPLRIVLLKMNHLRKRIFGKKNK